MELTIVILIIMLDIILLPWVHGAQTLLASVGWHGMASVGWHG